MLRFLKYKKSALVIMLLSLIVLAGEHHMTLAVERENGSVKITVTPLSEKDKRVHMIRQDVQEMQVQQEQQAFQEDFFAVEQPDDVLLLPDGVKMQLKYTQHVLPNQYILAKKANTHIRDAPRTDAKSLKKTYTYERFDYLETVQPGAPEKTNSTSSLFGVESTAENNEKWAHVSWIQDGKKKFGFIRSDLVTMRTFRFDDAYQRVCKEEKEFAQKISYINNYKDMTGQAPAYQGKDTDAFGGRRYQSAPGYESCSSTSEFRYIDDGSLVSILAHKDGFYRVKVHSTGYICWVPEKYIPAWKKIGSLIKVIVIDLKNQNEILFEKGKDGWSIVSYTLATTGARAEHKYETLPGCYYVIEKRDKFDYLDDITKEVTGYAPYAVRFTGGAYIHGVPVNYRFEGGKRIDPGMQEESKTLGTIPLSHKCVRNYTSHAKFVRDWADIGKTAVIVM